MTKLTRNQNADNAFRTRRGRDIIERYRKDYDRGEDDETVINDLLADLMHAVHDQHLNFHECVDYALVNYQAELKGED